MTVLRSIALGFFLVSVLGGPAGANGTSENDPGLAFVEKSCARCHAIGEHDASPLSIAPPLRDIANRYPLEGLEEAFAEGIVVGHPAMPEFELEPDEISDLIGYLERFVK